MEQRMSMITLGVADLARATAFYETVLGWNPEPGQEGIAFFDLGGVVLALYPYEALAEDFGEAFGGNPAGGNQGFALAYNTRTREEVDEIFTRLSANGVKIVKAPQEVFWGGYSGYFEDPEGYRWEVAHNPFWRIDAAGRVVLHPNENIEKVDTKDELMAEMKAAWNTLTERLHELSLAQKTGTTDDQGWTVVDHITHLVAWERSVVSLLQGSSRASGLGIDEALYRSGDFDAMNAIIRDNLDELTPQEAEEQLKNVHAELLALIEPRSDADLKKSAYQYSSGEADDGKAPRILDVIFGNTAAHYREHLEWIEALIA